MKMKPPADVTDFEWSQSKCLNFCKKMQKYGKSNPSPFDSQLRQGVIDLNE